MQRQDFSAGFARRMPDLVAPSFHLIHSSSALGILPSLSLVGFEFLRKCLLPGCGNGYPAETLLVAAGEPESRSKKSRRAPLILLGLHAAFSVGRRSFSCPLTPPFIFTLLGSPSFPPRNT